MFYGLASKTAPIINCLKHLHIVIVYFKNTLKINPLFFVY